jgi:hypothetical protein
MSGDGWPGWRTTIQVATVARLGDYQDLQAIGLGAVKDVFDVVWLDDAGAGRLQETRDVLVDPRLTT